MKKQWIAFTGAGCLMAVGAVGILKVAQAQDSEDVAAKIKRIAAGSDYLQTNTGTSASLPLNGKLIKVTLKGVPIMGPAGPLYGNTDTIVQRTQNAVFATTGAGEFPDTVTASVPITLTALNLTGTVPGPSGGFCTVNLTLAPSPASTGTLNLSKASPAATSGTYTSTVSVYFNATFTPIAPNTSCYPPILNAAPCTFKQDRGKWSTTPVPGEFLYTGSYPGVQYNQHTGMPAGFGDFYMTKPQTDVAATAQHATCAALAAAGTPCP